MNPEPDASPTRGITSLLASWYASHALVRRLWATEDATVIRILLALEPTVDGGDTQPVWLANSSRWTYELQRQTRKIVRLELLEEPSHGVPLFHERNALLADISWRDPTASG